jgi:hypothetical protein
MRNGVRVDDSEFHTPNFLAGNGYSKTCDNIEDFLAKHGYTNAHENIGCIPNQLIVIEIRGYYSYHRDYESPIWKLLAFRESYFEHLSDL